MILKRIRLDEIYAEENRAEGGQGDIKALARNIQEFGQITPIAVVEDISNSYSYRVIAGRRRLAAFKLLAKESSAFAEIAAVVYAPGEVGEHEDELALAENTAREAMHPLDEGIVFAKMLAAGESVEEVGALFCRSKSQVYQRAKLANLTTEMREIYKAGSLSAVQAAQVASFAQDQQEKMAREISKAVSKNNNFTKPIYQWKLEEIIKKTSPLIIGEGFTCEKCADCPKRTRFGDATLFEELGNAKDYCFDSACYHHAQKEAFDKLLSEVHAEEGDAVENVIIYDKKYPIPEQPGETGCILCNGENYSTVTFDFVTLLSPWHDTDEYRDAGIIHRGFKYKSYGQHIEACDFVYKKDADAIEAKKAEKMAEEDKKECDATLSALPESLREKAKEESKKERNGVLIGSNVVQNQTIAFLRTVWKDNNAFKIIVASYIEKLFRNMSSFSINLVKKACEIEAESYEALVALDVSKLLDIADILMLQRLAAYNYSVESIESCDVIQRLKEAGFVFDAERFRDNCVKEQYRDMLAEYAAAACHDEPDMESVGIAESDDEADESDEKSALTVMQEHSKN